MHESFATAIRSRPPFNASTLTCIYKLAPQENDFVVRHTDFNDLNDFVVR